jgi:hypothetical protein
MTCPNCERYGHNLVELLESAERRARLAHRALTDAANLEGDHTLASYVIAVQARNTQLEANLAKWADERAGKTKAAA